MPADVLGFFWLKIDGSLQTVSADLKGTSLELRAIDLCDVELN